MKRFVGIVAVLSIFVTFSAGCSLFKKPVPNPFYNSPTSPLNMDDEKGFVRAETVRPGEQIQHPNLVIIYTSLPGNDNSGQLATWRYTASEVKLTPDAQTSTESKPGDKLQRSESGKFILVVRDARRMRGLSPTLERGQRCILNYSGGASGPNCRWGWRTVARGVNTLELTIFDSRNWVCSPVPSTTIEEVPADSYIKDIP